MNDFEKVLCERIGEGLYQKFKNAKVAVAGLGGLGSNIAVMLVRSGIGNLHIVDFDTVDITNVNRQVYDMSHIGIKKTIALMDMLKKINPYINVTADCITVNEHNAVNIFGDCSIVCEAFDRAENKAMLVNTLLERCPNTAVISGNGMAGIDSGNAIKTRKLTDRFYICGDGKSDILDGEVLMAPRVNICAGHQANTVLRIIAGKE